MKINWYITMRHTTCNFGLHHCYQFVRGTIFLMAIIYKGNNSGHNWLQSIVFFATENYVYLNRQLSEKIKTSYLCFKERAVFDQPYGSCMCKWNRWLSARLQCASKILQSCAKPSKYIYTTTRPWFWYGGLGAIATGNLLHQLLIFKSIGLMR